VAVAVNTLPTLPISAFCPEGAGLIPEIAHLRRHVAKARGRAHDDRVVLGQLVHRRNWSFLIQLDPDLPGLLFRNQFRHTFDHDFDALHLGGAGRHLAGQRFDVAVHAVVQHQHPCFLHG